jgi:hypothetical protein
MNLAVTILSIMLALLMAASGVPKILNTASAQKNSIHLGISDALSRFIGTAELAATGGLLVGIAWHPLASLTFVTGGALVVLMAGALTYHVRAHDTAGAMAPAVLTAVAAGVLTFLSILR